MDFARPKETIILDAGGVYQLTVASPENFYVITGSATLANDADVEFDITPPDGTQCVIEYRASVVVGIHDLTILGKTLTANQALKKCFIIGRVYGGVINSPVFMDFSQAAFIETAMLMDESVTLAKMEDGLEGDIIIYDASGRPQRVNVKTNAYLLIANGTTLRSVAQSGDGSFDNNGVFSITAGALVDADFNASAGLTWSKMATSTAGFIIVFDAGGVPTPVVMSGHVAISDAGVTTIQPNVIAGSMLDADAAVVPYQQYVSFETGELQDNDFVADFDGTIVSGEGSVATAIGITDAAVIQFKIDGTNVTNGSMSFPATSIVGVKLSCTPTGANTFTKGQVLSMTCTKATDNGGHVNCKMLVKRA